MEMHSMGILMLLSDIIALVACNFTCVMSREMSLKFIYCSPYKHKHTHDYEFHNNFMRFGCWWMWMWCGTQTTSLFSKLCEVYSKTLLFIRVVCPNDPVVSYISYQCTIYIDKSIICVTSEHFAHKQLYQISPFVHVQSANGKVDVFIFSFPCLWCFSYAEIP